MSEISFGKEFSREIQSEVRQAADVLKRSRCNAELKTTVSSKIDLALFYHVEHVNQRRIFSRSEIDTRKLPRSGIALQYA
jgi:hypothetical protein